jgi:membrane associated rhomboid family serine protease
MNSKAHLAPGGGQADMTNAGYYPDTAYHSPGRASPDQRTNLAEDIPLQDRPGKDNDPNIDFDDHVYDDPNGRRSRRKRPKKHQVAEGYLGMLGANKKRIPWVVYIFTVAQIGVFIGEVIQNGILTGSPIMIKPQFNPMIGPSTQVLINMGARYTPCMRNVKELQGQDRQIDFLCPNGTEYTDTCPLSTLCGFSPKVPDPLFNSDINQSPEPNQWFRFILPIFMHAGLIHIGFNLLLQLTLAKEMEMAIGSVRFLLVYISAGVFGFVLGGNFAPVNIASTGASGSLFGIIALTLLDLLYSWKDRKNPVKELLFIILDMAIAFVLGLLPGLDNFSHIGGFLMGLALGICVLHSPNSLRRKLGDEAPYSTVNAGDADNVPNFFKSPVGFFKGRKKFWWAWWLVRAGALILVVVIFSLLLNNFYNVRATCGWCRHLSCLDVNNWCELGMSFTDDNN